MLRDRPGLGATAGAEHRHLRGLRHLVSPPQIVQANGDRFRGKVSFTAPAADSVADYQNAVARLQVDDAAMKYRADSIEFMLPGLPEQVKAITGVSGVEEWGRWSDANWRRRSTSITSIRCRSASIWCCAPAPTATTSANRFRCASATKSASCRSANRTAPSPCASTTRAARRRSALPAGADRAERERQRRLYAEEAGHRPGVAEGRSGRPRLLIPFTGAVFSLPRPSFRPSFYALLRLTCDGKTPQPRHRAGTSKEKV